MFDYFVLLVYVEMFLRIFDDEMNTKHKKTLNNNIQINLKKGESI